MPGPKKGQGGAPSKPIERKRRTGNPGGRPLPEPGSLASVLPLDPGSVVEVSVGEVFDRVLADGVAWIARSDAVGVVMAREAIEYYAELKANPQSKPADVIAAFKAMHAAVGELGFTPSERSRLGLAEVTAASKLEEIRARRTPVVDSDDGGRTEAG